MNSYRRRLILGEYDTARDGKFTLTELSLETPPIVENYIDVPGMDGSLDFCDGLDKRPRYKARKLSAALESSAGSLREREKIISAMISQLHGKRLRIVHPDHPDKYLTGRVTVQREFNNLAYCRVSVNAVCGPWFYDSIPHYSNIRVLPKAQNAAVTAAVTKMDGLSSCTNYGIISETDAVPMTLNTMDSPIHSIACWRLSVTPSTEYYVSGSLFGNGYWRVGNRAAMPEQFSPIVKSSADGFLYFWIHRLSPTGVCNIRQVLCLPLESVSTISFDGGFASNCRIQLDSMIRGTFSIHGNSFRINALTQTLPELPQGPLLAAAFCCDEAAEIPDAAQIIWEGISL